jgi:phosphoribosyl 1,2-cyclic phosphodiesterase
LTGLRFRVIGSGSSGNATLVEAGGTRLLVDAGLGPRELAERLQAAGVDPGSLSAIVISHEHQDHARGAVSFSRKWGVRVLSSRGTYAAAGLGAEDIAGFDLIEPETPRTVGAMTVTGVPLPHDAAGPYGFVVRAGDSALGHATDFGHVSRRLVEAFRRCDAVLIESNYDPGLLRDSSYPWSVKERIFGAYGHLSNQDCARYLAHGLGESCRTVVLAHLSQNSNHPELARRAAEEALARRGRTEVRVEVTGPDGTGWIAVPNASAPDGGPRQLRLF